MLNEERLYFLSDDEVLRELKYVYSAKTVEHHLFRLVVSAIRVEILFRKTKIKSKIKEFFEGELYL